MKILITGGAGFIGSNIVDRVIEEGHEAYIIDNLSTGKREKLNVKAKFYHTDILNKNLTSIFMKVQPDVVMHLAAQISVQTSNSKPILDSRTNILGTLKILELCKEYKCKLIYSSSAAVYGNPIYLPIREDHPKKPLSNYGISKYTPELYIQTYSELYNLNFTILRYANVYGKRQDPTGEGGVISIFINKMLHDEHPIIYGDGEQTRDFIYIEDIVSANIAAITKGNKGVYNISNNTRTSLKTLVNELNQIIQKNITPIFQPSRTTDIEHSCLNNQKAHKDLNWQPGHSLREGLEKTCLYYKK